MRWAVGRGGGAILALLLGGCAGGGLRTGDVPLCPDTRGQRVLDLLNRVRVREGLDPLVVDLRLVDAAQAHADDMAAHDFSGHEGSDGSLPADRVDRSGYPWSFVAENASAGYATAAATFAGWMASPSHRANNLHPEARHVGIGYRENGDTGYRTFWAVVFADSELPPRTTVDRCHP